MEEGWAACLAAWAAAAWAAWAVEEEVQEGRVCASFSQVESDPALSLLRVRGASGWRRPAAAGGRWTLEGERRDVVWRLEQPQPQ